MRPSIEAGTRYPDRGLPLNGTVASVTPVNGRATNAPRPRGVVVGRSVGMRERPFELSRATSAGFDNRSANSEVMSLSPREHEVLYWLAQGKTGTEVGTI